MKKLFFSGLIVTVPLGLTVYVLVVIYQSLMGISGWLPLPEFPGSAAIYVFLIILLIGFLSQWWVTRKGILLLERMISAFPGVKTLYQMTKDTISSFAGEKRAFSQVILFEEQEQVYRIGFLTTEHVDQFRLGQDYISVYFPHGLQVSGEIRLVPRERVSFVDTPVEDALQFCISAGVVSKKKEME